MDTSAISPASVVASQMAMTPEAAGMLMMRKVLDMASAQGAMLAQMVDQAAGLGRNMDTSA
jgi:hypothetical protein